MPQHEVSLHGNSSRELGISRRGFLYSSLLIAAADSIINSGLYATPAPMDAIHETLNALLAFVVPGPDAFSVAQGVTTPEPGGPDAQVTDILIETLDLSAPYAPQFSGTVAGILDSLAQVVNPSASGAFTSWFARLSFPEKATVFQIMDATDQLKPLSGVLLAFVAYLCYSEAGVFDPTTRSLSAQPVGWTISNYSGTAEGRDEFLGYFQNRRRADDTDRSEHHE